MKLVPLFFILFSLNLYADAGLTTGHQYSSEILRGRVHTWCQGRGGPAFRLYNCGIRTLEPKGPTYFYTDSGVEGDKVYLRNSSIDNSQTKKYSFDSATGKSTRRVNLWTDTITQRPLLTYGDNVIEYQIEKKRKVVEEGSFNVFVEDKGTTQCRDMTYNLPFRCDDYVYVCDYYFFQTRSCQ